jgi:hypothetical protein
MILQLDSALIQQVTQEITGLGVSFLPPYYQLFAPAISAIITAITAAIIRHVEKKKIKSNHEKERSEIMQAYLKRDTEEMARIIHEINKNEHEI